MAGALVLLVWAGAPARAAPPDDVAEVPVEGARHLARFRRALSGIERGGRAVVRVLQYGDSHVEGLHFPASVRDALQKRWGAAGTGYLLPRPRRTRTGPGARLRAGPGWERVQVRFVTGAEQGDGRYGLAGAALEGGGPAAWLRGRVTRDVTLELHVLCRPGGGRITIRSGGTSSTVGTVCRRPQLRTHRWSARAGERLAVTAGEGSVRVLGLAGYSSNPGLAWDVLGINGHQASAWLQWDAELTRAQLGRRPPSLVILGYGGNEAFERGLSVQEYRRRLDRVLAVQRNVAPTADCLLVGPLATCPRLPRVVSIREAQREAAAAHGCAFWDAAAVSGGPGSLCRWKRSRPPRVARDGLHLTPHGYRLLGVALAAGLIGALTAEPPY